MEGRKGGMVASSLFIASNRTRSLPCGIIQAFWALNWGVRLCLLLPEPT